MAKVKFPRTDFEKALGQKIDKKIEEKINLLGTPLESLNEEEIEIEIFPNRPDMLSMHGYIRGLKAFIGKSSDFETYEINKPQKNYTVKIDSSVKNIRPFTACAIIKNLNLNDEKIKELIDIQEKIHSTIGRNRKKGAIGIYPLERIKLPITYTALKPSEIKFIPLESNREMTAPQILKRHPAGQAYGDLLKGLSEYPVFLDSNNKVLSMPPIINSKDTGKVSNSTKDVFVECSGFDFEILSKILNILITTLADMSGKVYAMNLDYKDKKRTTPNLEPEKIKVSLENTNKLLGLNLKESDLTKLLAKMGLNYKSKEVLVPGWRTDILHEVDIIEDIAIAYGYDKFTPEIPNISTVGQESPEVRLISKVSEILIGIGLTEISTYHMIKQDEAKKINSKDKLELSDSKTDYKILRPNLLIPALRILAENKDNEYPQNLFEIGTVFNKDEKEETQIKESTSLIIALTPGNFTEAKQHLDALFRALGLEYKLKESSHSQLIDGRTGTIFLKEKEIGYIGEVSPQTLNNWHLKLPLSIVELNLDEIFKRIN